VYDTASKAGYGPAIGAKGFAAFVQATSLPVFGIGGIERPNIREVIAAGAAGIAVMGSVMRTADPAGTMQALIGSLEKATR
jgi:thiamine-phosphate pyrophosphorylase